MSIYNMLFGKNPNTDIVLALIGLKKCDVERFRDCGISDKGIYIYTRTGGGNREDYPNEKLTTNPYYIYDHDDSFDNTYATYIFKFPDEIAEDVKCFSDIETYGIPGNLIRWLNKTLKREPTEEDIQAKVLEESGIRFESLIRNGDLTRPQNGHTCIILSDDGAEAVFKMAEKGEMRYLASPMKFEVIRDEYECQYLKKHGGKGKFRILIKPTRKWELDIEAAKRYMELFAAEYPKAAEELREQWGMWKYENQPEPPGEEGKDETRELI